MEQFVLLKSLSVHHVSFFMCKYEITPKLNIASMYSCYASLENNSGNKEHNQLHKLNYIFFLPLANPPGLSKRLSADIFVAPPSSSLIPPVNCTTLVRAGQQRHFQLLIQPYQGRKEVCFSGEWAVGGKGDGG